MIYISNKNIDLIIKMFKTHKLMLIFIFKNSIDINSI
jgi:hypothetical protein